MSGTKRDLANRLASKGLQSRDEILSRRQAFQDVDVRAKSSARKAGRRPAKRRMSSSSFLSDDDFQKLWWAVKAQDFDLDLKCGVRLLNLFAPRKDGCLRCAAEGCGSPLRGCNGRFGLFLFCGSCGHREPLSKAALRLPEGHVATLMLELEVGCVNSMFTPTCLQLVWRVEGAS